MERSWPWEEQGLEHSRQEKWHTERSRNSRDWDPARRHDREWHRMQRKVRERLGFFSFLIRVRIHWRIMLCYLLEHRSSLEEHSVSWSTLNSFHHTTVQTGKEPQPLSLDWACTQMHACEQVCAHTHTHTCSLHATSSWGLSTSTNPGRNGECRLLHLSWWFLSAYHSCNFTYIHVTVWLALASWMSVFWF